MLCRNCGSEVPAESLFCIHCGERVDAMPLVPQAQYANPLQTSPKKPLNKRKKALVFGGVGAVLLAVVLILVFTLSGGGGPLSGNTVQTRFVNENARFLSAMLDDFQIADVSRMLTEPFDYTVNIKTEMNGQSSEQEMAMAYDRQTLGIAVESDYSAMTLLLADSIIMDSNGYVQVYEFDTDADMDAAMSLKDRISAMLDTGDVKVDYKKLVELFVNSIPENCFEKAGDRFTLTLDVKDIVHTLNGFATMLEEEKEIDEAFRDVIKEATGRSRNLSDVVQDASDQLDAASGYVDFELVWELSYDNGAPTALSISFEEASGYADFTLDMEYENVSGGKDIAIELETAGGYSDFSLDMTTTNTSGGLKFEGDVRAPYNKISFMGYQIVKGADFTIMMDASMNDYDYSYEAQGTIQFGMPDKDVESDRRFDIDTDDAYYNDLWGQF